MGRREPDAPPTLLQHMFKMMTYGAVSPKSSVPPSWRAHLSKPLSLYGMSSFTYSVTGLHALFMSLHCPGALPAWADYFTVEAVLVTIQGVLSFCADVLNIGRPSIFHVLDRCLALTLTGLQLLKFAVILPPWMSRGELAFVWLGIAVGIYCKVQGYNAILHKQMERFRTWHIWWHFVMPLAIGAWHGGRWLTASSCAL